MSIYIGIDWSEVKHDIAFVNAAGQIIAETTMPHTPAGLHKFDELRQRFGVAPEACVVALETAHNLLIDYLWTHAYDQVYVVPPSVVKSCRGRYRQSGAHGSE